MTGEYTAGADSAGSESDEADAEGEVALKMVVLGDSCGGKTSLCARFAQHVFNAKYVPTAGVDFYSRRITLTSKSDVLVQLWDVGGQSINSTAMLRTYVFGANALLFVYDVTNTQCFENICDWIGAIRAVTDATERTFRMFLVGTKTDLEHRRSVTVERNNGAASQYGLEYFYVSAKTGDNVELMFKTISSRLMGVVMTRQEVEWNIDVVQAPLSVDAPPNVPRQLYQPRHHSKTSVGATAAPGSSSMTRYIAAATEERREKTRRESGNNGGASSSTGGKGSDGPAKAAEPPPPAAMSRLRSPMGPNRNSAVCTIS